MKQTKIPYNFTPIDNNLIDHEMRYMTGGEFKHYVFSCRRTIGTKVSKMSDSISLGEFNQVCGSSESGAIRAIKGLERAGFISVERGKKGSKMINKITILMLDKEKYVREKLANVEDLDISTTTKMTVDDYQNDSCNPSDNRQNDRHVTDVTDIKTAEHQKQMQLSVENAQFIAEEIMTQKEKVYQDAGAVYNRKSNEADFNPIYDLFRVKRKTYDEVWETVEFAFSDTFWRSAIISTASFKKNYDKLRVACSNHKQQKSKYPDDLSERYG